MPNASVHRLGAALAVGGSIAMDPNTQEKQPWHPVAGGGIAYMAGTLPDILEPATSPNHRQFFHSWAVVGAGGYGLYRVWKWEPKTQMQTWCRLALLASGGAYLMHLLMDAGTPKGLPLI